MRMGLDSGRVHVLKSHFTPDVFTVLFTPSVFGPLLFTPLSVLSPEGGQEHREYLWGERVRVWSSRVREERCREARPTCNQSAVRSSRALVCARSASRQGTYTYVHTLNELHVWCDLVRGRWLVARPFAPPLARLFAWLAARLFDLRSCGGHAGAQ